MKKLVQTEYSAMSTIRSEQRLRFTAQPDKYSLSNVNREIRNADRLKPIGV